MISFNEYMKLKEADAAGIRGKMGYGTRQSLPKQKKVQEPVHKEPEEVKEKMPKKPDSSISAGGIRGKYYKTREGR